MPQLNRVAFFCRDGCVYGNPIIISNYSHLLSNAFDACPGKPAIKLANTLTRDLKCLFHVLNSLTFAEVSNPRLTGLQNVARLLDIDLTLRNGRNGFIRVRASPLSAKTTLPASGEATSQPKVQIPSDTSTISSNVSCERSMRTRNTRLASSNNGISEPLSSIKDNSIDGFEEALENDSILVKNTSKHGDSGMVYNDSSISQEEPHLDIDMDKDNGLSIDTGYCEQNVRENLSLSNSSSDVKQLRICTKKYYTKTSRKEEYSCNVCKYTINSWFSIKTHIETQHFRLEFECKKCGYLSYLRPEMMKHLRNVHKSRSATDNLYVTRHGERVPEPEESATAITKEPKVEVEDEEIDETEQHDDSYQPSDDPDALDELNEQSEPVDEKTIMRPVKPFERLSSRIPDINKDCYQMVKIGNRKLYKCLTCEKECKTYCGIREHQYSTHFGYICICNHCDVKYRSRSNMFKVINFHYEIKRHLKVAFVFQHLSVAHQVTKNFTLHFGYYIEEGQPKIVDIPKEPADTTPGNYRCKICFISYSDRESTINHLIYKHRIKSDVSPFLEEVVADGEQVS